MNEEKIQEEILEEETASPKEETASPEEESLAEEEFLGEEAEPEQDLVKELAEARAEAAEQKDQVLRIAAEFENYKKRMMRERTTAMKYAGEPILREILPVVDNLERAISHQGEVGEASAENGLASLFEGVQLTLKSLLAALEKFEVRSIESIGQPFDPTVQEALTMEASDTVPANHVIIEFEKGYHYKDRLLRAAKVIVSAGDQASS